MPTEQANEKLNVPVVDISALVTSKNSSAESINATVKAIGNACREWGFFYIVGHGVEPEFIEKVHSVSKDFFKRSKDFKRSVSRSATKSRGYSDYEFTKQKVDWKEVIDFTSDRGDRKERIHKDIDQRNQWPAGMDEFREYVNKYFETMLHISEKLMSAIFSSLEADPDQMSKYFSGSRDTCTLRLNYYPVCPEPKAHLGVGPHADPSALTILWQDQEVSSLQVEKDGVFYDVQPVPNSFVINTGDMTQVWSNGLYQAPVHRVLANHLSERFSTPFFYGPSYSCEVKPLESCVSKENPSKYKPINFGHFRKTRFDGNVADLGEEIQIAQYKTYY